MSEYLDAISTVSFITGIGVAVVAVVFVLLLVAVDINAIWGTYPALALVAVYGGMLSLISVVTFRRYGVVDSG